MLGFKFRQTHSVSPLSSQHSTTAFTWEIFSNCTCCFKGGSVSSRAQAGCEVVCLRSFLCDWPRCRLVLAPRSDAEKTDYSGGVLWIYSTCFCAKCLYDILVFFVSLRFDKTSNIPSSCRSWRCFKCCLAQDCKATHTCSCIAVGHTVNFMFAVKLKCWGE